MYTPQAFDVEDRTKLHQFIQQNSFATVISVNDSLPVASHLPLLFDDQAGEHGTLTGHMAKANSHWKTAASQAVMCIFHGPHAYISPTWYESENVVPTWNYVAVHAYGKMTLETDPQRLTDIVQCFVDAYESTMPKPWALESVSSDFIANLVGGIVGFTINVERLEGKWKLSQNHSPERQQRVIDGLRERNDGDDQKLANLMHEQLRTG